ncbi:MAG: hypothetical protein ACYTDE_10260 [Planctomycetota bacterium]
MTTIPTTKIEGDLSPLQRDIHWLRARLDEIQDGTARRDVEIDCGTSSTGCGTREPPTGHCPNSIWPRSARC